MASHDALAAYWRGHGLTYAAIGRLLARHEGLKTPYHPSSVRDAIMRHRRSRLTKTAS